MTAKYDLYLADLFPCSLFVPVRGAGLSVQCLPTRADMVSAVYCMTFMTIAYCL